jgi:hypothetical protein
LERTRILLALTNKIVALEQEQQIYDFHSKPWCLIDDEITQTKKTIQDVMNSKCPLIRG